MGEFSTPFDEFEHPNRSAPAARPGRVGLWLRAGLRGLSFGALWVAIVTAGFLIGRHALPLMAGSQPPISFKSAVPLIAIGISYLVLILSLQRTQGQRLVGVFVGVAFVLWGSEQFLSDQRLVSFIDDVVVFLFVVDLSIVIRRNLRSCAGERQVWKACFPIVKAIESFNFAVQPSIDEDVVRTLLEGNYIKRRENIIVVGKSGTGKTHLALAFGYAACLQKKRVLFTTASSLVTELIDSCESQRLRRFYRRLNRLDLLIVDEIGYGRSSELGNQLLFEVLRAAYERVSLVVTTTIPLEKWNEIFKDESVAKSAADRLLDRGHLLEATGAPYWKSGRNGVVRPKSGTL